MNSVLDSLNSAQKQAASHIDGALLILAGAGSGKTKTLTTRLAYLIDEIGIPAHNTLTLTFTNKASNEMRERALNLLTHHTSSLPLLCTFHRFGLLFLKFHIHILGRQNNFVLLDSVDKKNILKNFEMRLNLPPSYLRDGISNYKNNLITPQDALMNAKSKEEKELARIYNLYTNQLNEQNLLDFDDLLLLPYQILQQDETLCQETSKRYAYIMVDEYQDTNFLQFKLLQLLCASHQNLCVVGDDDQSIYSWRGADIGNILNFQKHFKDTKLIKLEENYRSSVEILNTANILIAHNINRIGKTLKSTQGHGDEVELLHFPDGNTEAQSIAKKIMELKKKNAKPEEIAILFRLNALSRNLEESLSRYHIPYKLLGTIRFYERAEIKDILAYLRYLCNPDDDFSLSRIINNPRRGIGSSTQEKIFELARLENTSVYKLFLKNSYASILSTKILDTLSNFFKMIEMMRDFLQTPRLLLDKIFEYTQILQTYDKSEESLDRLANIEEFTALLRDYFLQNPDDLLQDFLNNIPLQSDLDDTDDKECIRVLSIHTAKGLEFDHVFVIGMENGLFPLMYEGSNLEEERRLAYVAFTRARKNLYISYADSRFYKGKTSRLEPSIFLKESGLLKQNKTSSIHNKDFNIGDMVTHKIFGNGRIENIKKNGADKMLIINFGGLVKTIMADFIQKLEN